MGRGTGASDVSPVEESAIAFDDGDIVRPSSFGKYNEDMQVHSTLQYSVYDAVSGFPQLDTTGTTKEYEGLFGNVRDTGIIAAGATSSDGVTSSFDHPLVENDSDSWALSPVMLSQPTNHYIFANSVTTYFEYDGLFDEPMHIHMAYEEGGEIKDSTIYRPLKEPKDLLTEKIICIYPDTLVWARDFQFSYNDPLLQMYFKHPGYADYPVVGVTWEQAHAFCNWRTKLFNQYSDTEVNAYRLPTEAQWEYAARGGRKLSMYPWGGNYARDGKGCFFANFKPYRGAYNDDTGTTTMKVAQYRPNDFGLFDMAGNVSEWTNSAYQTAANTHIHDLNPDYSYMARKADPDILKRKVVKGGSWKDISYFMQCGVRTYEYQYESRPYIGFRCVRSYIGD